MSKRSNTDTNKPSKQKGELLEEQPRKRRRITKKPIQPTVDLTQYDPVYDEPTPKNNEAIECAICYENIQTQGMLNSCDHCFCHACISKWAESSTTCPMCKQRFTQITKKDLHSGKIARAEKVTKRDLPGDFGQSESRRDLLLMMQNHVVHTYFDFGTYNSEDDEDYEDIYVSDDEEIEPEPTFTNTIDDPLIIED
jgi:hypothetical protein